MGRSNLIAGFLHIDFIDQRQDFLIAGMSLMLLP